MWVLVFIANGYLKRYKRRNDVAHIQRVRGQTAMTVGSLFAHEHG